MATRDTAPTEDLPEIRLGPAQVSDLLLLSYGACAPLKGFMGQDDYESVIETCRLADESPWSLPLTLPAKTAEVQNLSEGQSAALKDESGRVLGVLQVEEIYEYNKEREAELVYTTKEPTHPGIETLYAQGEYYLAGPVQISEDLDAQLSDSGLEINPERLKERARENKWKSVLAYVSTEPLYRPREYLVKCALEQVDGLLWSVPWAANLAPAIRPATVLEAGKLLQENYFPGGKVLAGQAPLFFRHAGPREAIYHALVMKNLGCSHILIYRDYASIGNFYGPFDSFDIFEQFDSDELGIKPLFYDNAFYCKKCEGMATSRTCAHSSDERHRYLERQIQESLFHGEELPPEALRPEVRAYLEETLGVGENS